MAIIVAYSVNDPAGKGITRAIATYWNCEESRNLNESIDGLKEVLVCREIGAHVLGFEVEVIELEELEKLSNIAKYYVIVSKHCAKAGRPSLTTHPTGNPWGKNDAGGKPWEMPPSNPILMWLALNELLRHSVKSGLSDYSVCYEVTHHGPTSLSKPVTFIELGSGESEWYNSEAHSVVALSTVKAIERAELEDHKCVITVGFGGSHYAPVFTMRAFKENECYGHMIPNYVIKELSLDELELVAKKAIGLTPGAQRVVIEKMRLEIRKVIEEVARSRGLEVIRY